MFDRVLNKFVVFIITSCKFWKHETERKKKGWNYFFFNFSRYVAVDCELRTDGKIGVSNVKKGECYERFS